MLTAAPAPPRPIPARAQGSARPLKRAPSYSEDYSPFHQTPPEVLLRRMREPLYGVWSRLEAFIELETHHRFLYPDRGSHQGLTCLGVAVGTQAALAAHLQLPEATLCRTLQLAEDAGLLWRGHARRSGLVLALAPLEEDAWLWDLAAHRPEPFQPRRALRCAAASPAPDPSRHGATRSTQAPLLPEMESGVPEVEDRVPYLEETGGSPINERARVLDPDPEPRVRPDQTAPVPVVSSRPPSSPPQGPDRVAARAPAAPQAPPEPLKASGQGGAKTAWLDPTWSLPEALEALDLPRDVEPLPPHAQVSPEDLLDALTSHGRWTLPLHDIAPLLAQLLTVEQLRCIDSNLKRALRRGDLRDPRAYLLQATRAILDGTSHTAPPRHACTSLRLPSGEAGRETGHAEARSGEEEVVVVDATLAPVPGMEELRRWRDGLDEVTRRGFDARCYLLRAEIKAHHADTVGSGEEEVEEVVWQVAWGEMKLS